MIAANYDKRIKKIKTLICIWQKRKLSLTGKILIIKALALSQILFLANLLPFPDDKIAEIESIFYAYVWNGKSDTVKREVFIQNYEKGGHKIPDFKSIIHS